MFTRLHVRYTPEQATQDLALYSSGIQDLTQIRYITYNHEMESMFPICGVGWIPEDERGYCEDLSGGVDSGPVDSGLTPAEKRCSCAAAEASPWTLGALLGLVAVRRRRITAYSLQIP